MGVAVWYVMAAKVKSIHQPQGYVSCEEDCACVVAGLLIL